MYIRPQYLHSSVRTAMTQFMENPNKQFMFSLPLNMFSGQLSWHVGLHQSEPGSTLFDSNATQVPPSSCEQNTLAIFPQGNLSISCCISVIHLILEQRTCDVSLDMRFQTTDSLLNWIQKWRVWWKNLNLGIFRRSSSTMGRRTVENKIVCFMLIQMLVGVLQKLVEKCTCHASRLNLVIYQPKHWRYCQTLQYVPSFLPTHLTVSSVALSRTPLAS